MKVGTHHVSLVPFISNEPHPFSIHLSCRLGPPLHIDAGVNTILRYKPNVASLLTTTAAATHEHTHTPSLAHTHTHTYTHTHTRTHRHTDTHTHAYITTH